MCAGLKRKHDDGLVESIAKIFSSAEDRAAEMEERLRKLEMEMEERRDEREDRREEQMLFLIASLMQPVMGGYMQRSPFQEGMTYRPPQPPYQTHQLRSMEPPETNFYPNSDTEN